MGGADGGARRPFAAAGSERARAAGMKTASFGRIDQGGNLALDLAGVAPRLRQTFQQSDGVWVMRTREEVVDRRSLDLLARVHDGHAVANLIGGAEVVRGEQHRD